MIKKNKWKVFFFVLLGCNLLFLAVILFLISYPIKQKPEIENQSSAKNEYVSFKVNTNKQELNKIINHYLQEYKTRKMNYHIWLGKDVELYGTFPFFSQNIDMKMTFEPLALENGDLLLKQKSISIGQLSLPVANVMKIISRQYKIPEWVTIQPKEEQVYVSLQNMNLAGDLKVKLNEFNLIEDNIQFTFQVPSD